MGTSGGGNASYIHKSLMFSMSILILLPMFLGVFSPSAYSGATADELLEGYERMTGQAADTKVSVWPLTGIYTPFTGSFVDEDDEGHQQTITYGYTDDGWLYGTSISRYTPTQYNLSTPQGYTVYKDSSGVFRYLTDSNDYSEEFGTGHKGRAVDSDGEETYPGDLYTSVTFDVDQKSDIFFYESSRQEDSYGHFKYDYTGYRMAFQPISDYTGIDQDGNDVHIVATTTSLSLIWYTYLTQSGISGNLILTGSGHNGGIAYINAAQILSAFSHNTSTASFDMVFNGVVMTIYIKLDPVALQDFSVEDCYNLGYWSIMVTSMSTDASAYTSTDYTNNPMKLIQTVIDLLTFDMSDYNISGWLATLCSIVFTTLLYISLIAILVEKGPICWLVVGLLAGVQALVTFWPF